LSLLLAGGCDWQLPGKPSGERPVPPEYVLKFKPLFKRNCAGCHGADGTMGPAPPLNDPLFRALVPEKELVEVISKGRRSGAGTKDDPRTPMPAFLQEQGGTLSREQVQVLVYEIKGMRYRVERTGVEYDAKATVVEAKAGEKGIDPTWGETPTGPKDLPLYLAKGGNAKRGAEVFGSACSMCHGNDGKGVKQDDGTVTNALRVPAFLDLISDRALRRLVITGRLDFPDHSGLRMPRYLDKHPPDNVELSKDDISNVVALLASWRREADARSKGTAPARP
jgi:mono/diheme cytochrome c family protein